MSQEPIYSWRDLQRGTRKLTPKMWHAPEGDVIPTKGDLKGHPRSRKGESPTLLIRYDRDYVVYWVIENLLKPLMITNKDEMVSFATIILESYSQILNQKPDTANDKKELQQ